MIRDPSDGSVRQDSAIGNPITERKQEVERALSKNMDLIMQPASGLPLESTKPDRKERLDRSREWLRQYFKRNPEQGA